MRIVVSKVAVFGQFQVDILEIGSKSLGKRGFSRLTGAGNGQQRVFLQKFGGFGLQLTCKHE